MELSLHVIPLVAQSITIKTWYDWSAVARTLKSPWSDSGYQKYMKINDDFMEED